MRRIPTAKNYSTKQIGGNPYAMKFKNTEVAEENSIRNQQRALEGVQCKV